MNADSGPILLKVLAVVALVLLNGFFVAAEFALVKVRNTQLDPLIAKGHRRAGLARRLISHLDSTIGATQLGITLVSLGLGVLVEPVFQALLVPVFEWTGVESERARHSIAIGVGFFVNTFLLVVVGELGPKAVAIRKTLPTALWTAAPLAWFYQISYPFIWLLNWAAQWLLRQIGIQPAEEGDLAHSEEELRLLFAASQKQAGGTALGHDIVLNALDLRQRVVRDVMRPRQEIVSLSTTASMTECLDVAEKTRFSRFPLCEGGDLDKTLGVVHLKDLYAMRLKARRGAELISAARKIVYVPETARLEKLLQRFLERNLHLAIVVDEYGGTVGLVTLENILEELVGQIQDEFDQEKPMVVRLGNQTWEVLGALPVHQLEELVGEPLAEEGITTTSGWVTRKLGGFPKAGDVLTVGACQLRVEELDDTRVARLLLKRLPKTERTA
ncbi:MAG TPA: hemolysin family protein [Candidatus Binatia bacterium]|nr:hemolysin family protein [Candidatus Binatia bacterium]